MAEQEPKRARRLKKKGDVTHVDPSNIEYSISARKKKKIKLSDAAKKKISTSRTSEVAARRTGNNKPSRSTILGRRDPDQPTPAKKFNGNILMLTTTGLICGALLLSPLKMFLSQSHNIDGLQQQLDHSEQKFNEAQDLNNKWNDPEYVKQQARARLFYAMPGEQTYMTVGSAATKSDQETEAQENSILPGSQIKSGNSQANAHWYDSFMQSYNAANQGK